MKPKVILVDDEKLPIQYYVRALNIAGYQVKHFFDPDSAFQFIEKCQKEEIAAFILDVMMLPGKRYSTVDSDEGLRTGVLMYKELRKTFHNTPIVILTNITSPDTLSEIADQKFTRIANKIDYPPFELAELVQKLIGLSKNES